MLQSSKYAEERAGLYHKRSACILNSRSNKHQVWRAVYQATGTRSSLLCTHYGMRGINIIRILKYILIIIISIYYNYYNIAMYSPSVVSS